MENVVGQLLLVRIGRLLLVTVDQLLLVTVGRLLPLIVGRLPTNNINNRIIHQLFNKSNFDRNFLEILNSNVSVFLVLSSSCFLNSFEAFELLPLTVFIKYFFKF